MCLETSNVDRCPGQVTPITACHLNVGEMNRSAIAGNKRRSCWIEELCFFVIWTVERERARQTMSVLLSFRARRLSHCHSGKAKRITYSECVSIILGIPYAVRMRHIVMWTDMQVIIIIIIIIIISP